MLSDLATPLLPQKTVCLEPELAGSACEVLVFCMLAICLHRIPGSQEHTAAANAVGTCSDPVR